MDIKKRFTTATRRARRESKAITTELTERNKTTRRNLSLPFSVLSVVNAFVFASRRVRRVAVVQDWVSNA
jgi:hypothetical protein